MTSGGGVLIKRAAPLPTRQARAVAGIGLLQERVPTVKIVDDKIERVEATVEMRALRNQMGPDGEMVWGPRGSEPGETFWVSAPQAAELEAKYLSERTGRTRAHGLLENPADAVDSDEASNPSASTQADDASHDDAPDPDAGSDGGNVADSPKRAKNRTSTPAVKKAPVAKKK